MRDIHGAINSIEPPYTDRYVRWCERTLSKIITQLLLDRQAVHPLCIDTDVAVRDKGLLSSVLKLFLKNYQERDFNTSSSG
jgi:hypothetical protein